MPTGNVPILGSKGVQELGQEYNKALTDNILSLADSTINRSLTATKAKQHIEGRALVAAGQSLRSIKDGQSATDKIFGAGTLAGAKAQTITQAADKHVLDMQRSMHLHKKQTTEEFIKGQRQYVTNELLTGDAEIDNLIIAGSAESIAAATKIHAPAHFAYIQEESKLAFETGVTAANERLHSTLTDDKINVPDKIDSIKNLLERMQRQPGQTEEAYKLSQGRLIVSELAKDRPELYTALTQGGIEVNGQFVKVGEPINFGLDVIKSLDEAYLKHRTRMDTKGHVQRGFDLSNLEDLSKDPNSTDEELALSMKATVDKYGIDILADARMVRLFNNRSTAKLAKTKTEQDLRDIMTGASRLKVGSRQDVGHTLNLMESKLEETVQAMQPDQQEKGMQDAALLMNRYVIENDVLPSAWTQRWNNGFSSILIDNKPSPAFVQALQHFNSKYKVMPKLIESTMDETSFSNVIAVKELMQLHGMEVEQALQVVSANKVSMKDAKDLVNETEYSDKIDEYLVNPHNQFWFNPTDDQAIANTIQTRQVIKNAIQRHVARTGNTGAEAWPAAISTLRKTHEYVRGELVPHGGVPLRNQALLTDPQATMDDALTHYLNVVAKEDNKFGPGFDPTSAEVRINRGMVSIMPIDEVGNPLPGLQNSARLVPIQALGKRYNDEVTGVSVRNAINAKNNTWLAKQRRFLTNMGLPGLTNQAVAENQGAVDLIQGLGNAMGSSKTEILNKLQDPVIGPQLKSLTDNLTSQLSSGDFESMNKTIKAIEGLTGGSPRVGDLGAVAERYTSE